MGFKTSCFSQLTTDALPTSAYCRGSNPLYQRYRTVLWCGETAINSIMESLNPIHARAARVIHQDKSLEKLNWLPISYIYKRRLLLMHDVLNDKILYPPFNLRLGNRPSRTGGLQVEIPRVNYKVGKESAQYREPVIWNFIARLAILM